MGVIFEEWQERIGHVRPVLMDCGQVWGERFVRLTEFVAREYSHPSVFFFDGQIISDSIYVNVPSLKSLFLLVAQTHDRLFLGWAQYAAGILEVATQTLLHEVWADPREEFLPIRRGVSPQDIPNNGEQRKRSELAHPT
jgi:hypothetical protein